MAAPEAANSPWAAAAAAAAPTPNREWAAAAGAGAEAGAVATVEDFRRVGETLFAVPKQALASAALALGAYARACSTSRSTSEPATPHSLGLPGATPRTTTTTTAAALTVTLTLLLLFRQ